MKKQMLAMVMATAVAIGAGTLTAEAKDLNVEGSVGIIGMRGAAQVFLDTYPQGVIHSISLNPSKGQYVYKVEGYVKKQGQKLSIDILSGKVVRTEGADGPGKDGYMKVFNPAQVLDEHEASVIAVEAVGQGAVAKAWEVEADKGVVTYEVDVHQAGNEIDVTLNAKTGEVLAKSEPKPIEKED